MRHAPGTMVDMDTARIAEARTRKALRLVAALRHHLPTATPAELAAVASRLAPGAWETLALTAGVRPPSAATIAAAVAIVKADATQPTGEQLLADMAR